MIVNAIVKVLDYLNDTFPANLPELKLMYFDLAGLAECTRKVLNFSEYDFEDIRISEEKFKEIKKHLKFGQLPILLVNQDNREEQLVQSKAILRYVGRLTHMYPTKNPLNGAMVDEWVELNTEFMFPMIMNIYPDRMGLELSDTDKKKHRLWCIDTHIPKYLSFLEEELTNSQWLGGMDSPTIADFCWLPTLQWLSSGKIDGLSDDVLDSFTCVQMYVKTLETMKTSYEFEMEDDPGEIHEENNEQKEN